MRWNGSVQKIDSSHRLGRVGCALAILALGFLWSRPAVSYPNAKPDHRWIEPLDINIDDVRFVGSAARSSIRLGINSWVGIPGTDSPIGLVVEFAPDDPYDLTDEYNTITVANLSGTLPNAFALTRPRGTEGSLCPCFWEEMDVWVALPNPFGAWAFTHSAADSVPNPLDDFDYDNADLENVIRHEVGHMIGFVPEDSAQVAVMTPEYSYGAGRDPWLHGDDRNGLRWYYSAGSQPAGGWETDIQLSGWRLDYEPITPGAPGARGLVPVEDPFPIDVVAGNGSVGVEYVLENLGTVDAGTRRLGIYLSRDQAITQDDYRVDSIFVALPPPAIGGISVKPWKRDTHAFFVPCEADTGYFYVGAILDYDNQLPESRESNNTWIFPIPGDAQRIHIRPCDGTSPPPGQARSVDASDGTHCGVLVTWEPPTSGGVQLWGIYRNGNVIGWDPGAPGQPITYMWFDNFVVPDTINAYTVVSLDPNSYLPNGPYSEPTTGFGKANTLPSPSQVTASQDRSDGILVAWQWPSGSPNPDAFRVWREPLYHVDPVYEVAGSDRSYLLPAPLGASSYRVQSLTNSDRCFSNSLIVEGYRWSTTLATISASVNAPQCSAPTVMWSYAGNLANVQGYQVYRDGALVYTGTSPTETSWIDSEATASGGNWFIHSYWVDVYNPVATGRSDTLNVSVIRAPVGIAYGLAVSSSNQSGSCCEKLTVSWSWPLEFVDGWLIYRDGSAAPIDTVSNAAGASLTFTDYDVAPGGFHTYRIAGYSSVCGAGGQSLPGSGTLCWEPTQWVPNGVPIGGAAGAQSGVRAIAEQRLQRLFKETGAAYVAWEDRRNGDSDIYIQKVSEGGTSCWASDGVPVCTAPGDQTAVSLGLDAAGGVFVVWEDRRSGASDIYAQRVSELGVPMWATNGVAVCTASGDQSSPVMSGSIDAIVAWEDRRSGTSDIYGQMLTIDGVEEGYPNGFPICTAGGDQTSITVAGGPSGSCLVAWSDNRASLDSDIYMQRMFYNGLPAWSANGIPICAAPGIQAHPVLVTWPYAPGRTVKSAGIAWSDQRRGPELYDVYAHRIDVDQPQNGYLIRWTPNGVPVGVGASVLSPVSTAAASDPGGDLILAWSGAPQGSDLNVYAQRLDSNGVPLLVANGKPLCTAAGAQHSVVVATDGIGGAVAAWADDRNGTGYDIFARRIAPNGDLFGGVNGSAVVSMPGNQESPAIVTGSNGGAIVVWQDSRSGSPDVFATRAAPQGMLDLDLVQSYFVPEAGSVASPLQGTSAIQFLRTCPNNDGLNTLPNNVRMKVVLRDISGAPLGGVSESEISVLFNGGTTAQGFSGPGADSIIANSMWNPEKQCPDVRHIRADAPTNANGITYITLKGSTPGSPGVATRDPSRKWGHYDSDIPIYALGQRLEGRLTDGSANGSYQLQIKNADYTGGLGAVLNQGEWVTSADFNGVANNINTWNPIYYWRDFDSNGALNSSDFNFISTHNGHNCSMPEVD